MADGPSRAALTMYAVLSFAMSALMLYAWASFDGLPPRETLRSATGHVDWVKTNKYGVKFALQGSERAYDYASKGNAMGAVESTLINTREPVTVLYDPASAGGPIYSDEIYFSVLELSTPAGPFRRYEDIEAAWRSDNALALWMSPVFLCMAIYLLFRTKRTRRR